MVNSQAEAIPRATQQLRAPLAPQQIRFWLLQKLNPDSTAYNVHDLVRLHGNVQRELLVKCLRALAKRHPALRSVVCATDVAPCQLVRPEWGADSASGLSIENLPDVPELERGLWLHQWALERIHTRVDLETGPTFRVWIASFDQNDHALLLLKHHIFTDGWSMDLFRRELAVLYNAEVRGEAARLPEQDISFADYARWQNSVAYTRSYDADLDFWKQRMAGAPELLQLPLDRVRPASAIQQSATQVISIGAELSAAIAAMGKTQRITKYNLLLAAYAVLLGRLTGTDDIVVGTPVSGRNRLESENLYGLFVGTVPLRLNLADNPTLGELLGATQRATLEAMEHSSLPFDKLIEALNPSRALSYAPVVQASFAYQRSDASPWQYPMDQLTAEAISLPTAVAKFDLLFTVREQNGGMTCIAEYSSDLFDASTIDNWLQAYEAILTGMIDGQHAGIDTLPAATANQRAEVAKFGSGPEVEVPAGSIVQCFEDIVRSCGSQVAVEWTDGNSSSTTCVTYAALNDRANRIAGLLRERGVGVGCKVVLALAQDSGYIAAILAVLKVGAAYVPVDAAYPVSRIQFVLQDTGATAFIVSSAATTMDYPADCCCIDLEACEPELADMAGTNLKSVVGRDADAYVMYTSGTSGTPKGAVIPHKAVVRLVRGSSYIPFGPQQRMLQLSSVAFDASTFEIWGALLNGGVCVIPPVDTRTPAQIEKVIAAGRVSTLWVTAALFNTVIDERPSAFEGVSTLLTGGEALSPDHVRRAYEALPKIALYNGYGPTEATTFTTVYPIPRNGWHDRPGIPIGYPLADTQALVLDKQGGVVAPGVPGELFIGGDGVAKGYLNQPELNRERFVSHPHAEGGAKLYRSGDLVRWLPSGELEFLARLDNQIKLRGFRIEPGEIEAALNSLPTVKTARVAVVGSDAVSRRLVAFVISDTDVVASAGGAENSAEQLRTQLAALLPSYLLPDQFVELDALPLTVNGKLDHATLERFSVAVAQSGDAAPESAPVGTTECWLADAWCQLLNLDSVCATTSFFDLGGHSLLAVKLMARISAQYGVDLPLATLFERGSIRELAEQIDRREAEGLWSPLVMIQKGRDRAPLFLAHPLGGNVLGYSDFAKHFDADRPVYALQAHGVLPGQTPSHSLVEMAQTYIAEIRRVQPEGPYRLGGISLGGIVAHEMAAQLEEAGQRVMFLMLGDTFLRHGPHMKSWPWLLSGVTFPFSLRPKQIKVLWAMRKKRREEVKVHRTGYANEQHLAMKQAHTLALQNHWPRRVAASITLVKSAAVERGRLRMEHHFKSPAYGWHALTTNAVDTFSIDGNHHQIFYGDNAPRFAGIVERQLEEAERRWSEDQLVVGD